jgi:hypothetical protein
VRKQLLTEFDFRYNERMALGMSDNMHAAKALGAPSPSHWIGAAAVLAISVIFMRAVIVPSVAQEATPVTDTELRAAYCLGVATDQIEAFSTQLKRIEAGAKIGRETQQNKEDRITYKFMLDAVVERQERLRDYLKIKGFLSGRNIRLIELSLDRGVKDSGQCLSDGGNGPSDACARVTRCVENFLPF